MQIACHDTDHSLRTTADEKRLAITFWMAGNQLYESVPCAHVKLSGKYYKCPVFNEPLNPFDIANRIQFSARQSSIYSLVGSRETSEQVHFEMNEDYTKSAGFFMGLISNPVYSSQPEKVLTLTLDTLINSAGQRSFNVVSGSTYDGYQVLCFLRIVAQLHSFMLSHAWVQYAHICGPMWCSKA